MFCWGKKMTKELKIIYIVFKIFIVFLVCTQSDMHLFGYVLTFLGDLMYFYVLFVL